jgi:hypothetical protein
VTTSRAVPLRYARGNVLFGRRGEASSLFRLPGVSYALLPDEDKWSWLWAMAGLALRARTDFSIWRVQRRYPSEQYVDQALGLMDERHQDPAAWRSWLASHERHLAGMETHLPEVYLRLGQRGIGRTGRGVWRTLDELVRYVHDAVGLGATEPIGRREIDALVEEESRLLTRIRTALPATERATTRELQWLLRRAAVRHVAEPELDPWWRPNALVIESDDGEAVFEPREADWVRHGNAVISREDDHLIVSGDEAVSYQAFLTIGAMPEEAEFPGPQAELLLAPMEAVGFPIDVAMHCRWIANRKAVAEVQKAVIDATTAIRDAEAGVQRPDERKLMLRELGRALEGYLKSESRPPLLEATISFAVGAPDLRELRRRASALREQLAGLAVYQPAGLQERLYYDHLPSAGGAGVLDYADMLTLEQFGALMPIGTRKVGHARGVYIGHTVAAGRPRGPVRLDLTAPAADHLPTAIFMAGRQGSGKTVAAQLLAYVAAMRGSYAITADPKPDHNLVALPELAASARTIGLEADERFRGALDPLVTAPQHGGLREEIAVSYLLEVLPDDARRGGWETEIVYAVRDDAGGGLLSVLDRLRAGNEDGRDAARRLAAVSDAGLGILAFGDGSTARGFDEIERVMTFTMAGVELPAAEVPREHYTRADRIAVATFKLLAAHVMWLVTQDPTTHKVVVLDEAWTFLGTQHGRALLDKLVRLGRRFNATVIIASQTIAELGSLDDLIGMRFVFGANSRAEARRALELIGLDGGDEQLVRALSDGRQFRRGRCLFRDLDGDVAEVQFDAVLPHVLEVLDTSPSARRASVEGAAA